MSFNNSPNCRLMFTYHKRILKHSHPYFNEYFQARMQKKYKNEQKVVMFLNLLFNKKLIIDNKRLLRFIVYLVVLECSISLKTADCFCRTYTSTYTIKANIREHI